MTEPGRPPLAGLRVLDLSGVEGHYCGKLLADLGADVIKIEPPQGDPGRRIGPFADDRPGPNRSLSFWSLNTSKRGITLDVSKGAGQELFRRLLESADVLIESFPPGWMGQAGLDPAGLLRLRPALIVASITSFGQTGPWSRLRGSDLVSLALAGTVAMNGYDDEAGTPPIRPDGAHSYYMAGEYAFMAIMIGLLARDETGAGDWLDISIHEACAATTEGAFANWEYFQRRVRRQTGRHAQATPTAPWQHLSADGRYVNLIGGGIPRMLASWRPLIEWMSRLGKADDLADERYSGVVHRSATQRHDPDSLHVLETIGTFVRGLTAEEAYRGGQEKRLPWAIVRSPEENIDDAHWHDRGFFVDINQSQIGRKVAYPGAPYRFSRTPWRLKRRAPLLGEHNVEIYEGELGLSREQLRKLYEQGVI
jgi:crotonobetainyl-CoA:carnitine CoA-transferase CaiB-like acyl-CoA transferase